MSKVHACSELVDVISRSACTLVYRGAETCREDHILRKADLASKGKHVQSRRRLSVGSCPICTQTSKVPVPASRQFVLRGRSNHPKQCPVIALYLVIALRVTRACTGFLSSRVWHTFSKSDYEKRCPAVLVRILYWKRRASASNDLIKMYDVCANFRCLARDRPNLNALCQHIHCDEYVAITLWGDR